MVLKSALFICFLLSTASLSWAALEDLEGSGNEPDAVDGFGDDEDFSPVDQAFDSTED
jgi:hypothetical protein